MHNPSEPNSATAVQDKDAWTIQRLLQWTTHYLQQHGAATPRLDTEVLLAQALGCSRIDLYTRFEHQPTDEQRQTFRDWVRRRASGEPVAYLVGHREFYSLPLQVNPSVLIPRPETEHLVVEAIGLAKQHFADSTMLRLIDVGTGSGCIAVALAVHLPQAEVWAVDIDASALQVAQSNAERLGVGERVTFRQGDLLSSVPDDVSWDMVVANLPYIGRDEKQTLDEMVKKFEPHRALFAEGPSGVETIARLIPQAARSLNSGGYLLLEVSPLIAERIHDTLASDEHFTEVRVVKDLAHHQRVVVARRQ